jgi:hypothetical protein
MPSRTRSVEANVSPDQKHVLYNTNDISNGHWIVPATVAAGMSTILTPLHQDVWSCYPGGSGAPATMAMNMNQWRKESSFRSQEATFCDTAQRIRSVFASTPFDVPLSREYTTRQCMSHMSHMPHHNRLLITSGSYKEMLRVSRH